MDEWITTVRCLLLPQSSENEALTASLLTQIYEEPNAPLKDFVCGNRDGLMENLRSDADKFRAAGTERRIEMLADKSHWAGYTPTFRNILVKHAANEL